MITVTGDFSGKIGGTLGLGDTLKDIERQGYTWYEASETIVTYQIAGLNGIALKLANTDDAGAYDESILPITAITVFSCPEVGSEVELIAYPNGKEGVPNETHGIVRAVYDTPHEAYDVDFPDGKILRCRWDEVTNLY
jgi:hypothetical protein